MVLHSMRSQFSHLTDEQLSEYYLPRILDGNFASEHEYAINAPLLIPGDKTIYRQLAESKRQQCIAVQKKIDEEFTHQRMVDLTVERGQVFRLYHTPDHQVWAFNLPNEHAHTYLNVHWVRDEDDALAKEWCKITGLTLDDISYVHADDQSKFVSILHVRSDVDFLLHIHKKEGLSGDFLQHLSGEVLLKTATHPLNTNYDMNSVQLTDMMMIDPKQYHTGKALTDDVYLLSIQPKGGYREIIKRLTCFP